MSDNNVGFYSPEMERLTISSPSKSVAIYGGMVRVIFQGNFGTYVPVLFFTMTTVNLVEGIMEEKDMRVRNARLSSRSIRER